jgi:H+/Cl- antiporter ClcA
MPKHSVQATLIFMLMSMVTVESKKSPSEMKSSKIYEDGNSQPRFQLFFYIIVGILFLLFAPIVFTFFNSLRKDPAIPDLVKSALTSLKNSFSPFLGDAQRNDFKRNRTDASIPTRLQRTSDIKSS